MKKPTNMKKYRLIKNSLLLCIAILSTAIWAHAQSRTVTGIVTDAADGSALAGVTITIQGTRTATSTDERGFYSIDVPDNQTILVFHAIGYTTQEITVGNRSVINVGFAPDQTQLSEVVVTALGIERSQRSLGYAAQQVDSATLSYNRQPNLLNALQGKVAGAQISSAGGGPGQGASIRIRGINSIDPLRPNEPLFVIDGVLMDNSTNNFGPGNTSLRGMSNRAADINPDDIESINILRGGAATALYGLRGSNGVVVITTKKGSSGFNVNFSSTYGFENVNKVPAVQTTYTAGILGEYVPIGLGPAWGPTIAEAKAIDPDHPDKLFENYRNAFDTGQQFRNSLSMSGGNEFVRTFLSLSAFNHEGMLPFTDFNNYSVRLNNDFTISPKFSVGASLAYNNSGGYRYNADRFGESLTYFSGRWDVRDYLNEDGTQKWRGTNNPIYGAATNRFLDNVNRFVGGINFNYKPLEWLSLDYRLGYDTYSDNRFITAPGPRGIEGERLYDNADGSVGEYNTAFRAINSTFVASARTKLGEAFTLGILAGHELYDRQIKNVGVLGTGLTIYDWFHLANATTLQTAAPNREEYRLMGIFGEASLDYKDMLYLQVTGRQDITSSLAAPNNSFFYPSVSLSYIPSSHFDLPDYISFIKLRASYAQIGKDAMPYSTVSGYAAYTGLPPGFTGFTRAANLGNIELRPEYTNTVDIGTDLSFFQNRLGLDFTYYNSISRDQILRAQLSSSTGFVTASINAGDMRNRGVEIVLRGTPIERDDFQWTGTLNWSANRNKILSVPEELREIQYAEQFGYTGATVTMKLIEGEAYGNIYGSHHLRYNEPEGIHIDKSLPLVIGDNGFPVRAPLSSQKLLGNTQPDWIGGFSNTFTYKNISLTALFDARWGFEKYDQLENFNAAFGIADYTANRRSYTVFDGVLADGTPNTQQVWLDQGVDPQTGKNYGEGYYRISYRTVSENFVQDASWIRLRSVNLSYDLPTQWLQRSFIKTAQVSVTGNNLWLHTDYYGLDPESTSTHSGSNIDGFAGFTYPAARTFLFSINVGF